LLRCELQLLLPQSNNSSSAEGLTDKNTASVLVPLLYLNCADTVVDVVAAHTHQLHAVLCV
jgi:hypothetical protein